ncbi:MAG: hypothetical protein NZM33_00260 [Bryobacteraceae bacterium]|nr:hypothetical protein [Bryobacteraceae bacterium]
MGNYRLDAPVPQCEFDADNLLAFVEKQGRIRKLEWIGTLHGLDVEAVRCESLLPTEHGHPAATPAAVLAAWRGNSLELFDNSTPQPDWHHTFRLHVALLQPICPVTRFLEQQLKHSPAHGLLVLQRMHSTRLSTSLHTQRILP